MQVLGMGDRGPWEPAALVPRSKNLSTLQGACMTPVHLQLPLVTPVSLGEGVSSSGNRIDRLSQEG